VLSKNYLPVAQIRVRCKNGPQVSIDEIKLLVGDNMIYTRQGATLKWRNKVNYESH
jgi:hypothetical protein